jgi:hypothetical protein
VARSAIQAVGFEIGSLRLEPGSHSSPREGVCVVELASLLGGEEFSDRPRCVCAVIAAFMRSWNDRTAHADRQRLVPYAKRAVGSRAGEDVTRLRRDICLIWAGARLDGGPLSRWLQRLAMRVRILAVLGIGSALRLNRGAGEYAARVVFARYDTEAGFTLLDRLLEAGGEGSGSLEAASLPQPVEGPPQARVAAAVRQLAGNTQIAQGENGDQPAHHNGHPRHLNGGDPGQRHEEDIQDDRAGDGDPERETNPAEQLHRH